MKILKNSEFIVAPLLIILLLLIFCLMLKEGEGKAQTIAEIKLDNPVKTKALDAFINLTFFLASIALAMIGVNWGVLNNKAKEEGFRRSKLILLFPPVLAFIISLFCYTQLMFVIIVRGFENNAIEIRAPITKYWFEWQWEYLIIGTIIFVLVYLIYFCFTSKRKPT